MFHVKAVGILIKGAMIEPIREIAWRLYEAHRGGVGWGGWGSLEPAGCLRDPGSGQVSLTLVVQE